LGESENKGLMSKPDNFLFHSYNLHKESSLTHTRFLFNSAKHLRLQAGKNWSVYEILNEDSRAVKARIVFHIHKEVATSPLRAPFGFLEIYKKISTDELTVFFSLIETDLKNQGVKKINLKSYPEAYEENFKVVEEVLKKLHYTVSSEVSSIIPVDNKPLEKKIKISERQKLRKAQQLFFFERLNIAHLKEVYSFIADCREERNQRLSMSFSELKKTVAAFPKNFFLYRLRNESGTAAAAIVIKINKEILYTFYYAHARRFDRVSPVVLLIAEIYEWSQGQNVEMIDLGTSMIDGKINHPLLHFKKSIGGQSNRKLIFEKTLL